MSDTKGLADRLEIVHRGLEVDSEESLVLSPSAGSETDG